MKIRTLIGLILVAVVILAICVTSSLFVIRCTNNKKTQTYQNMKISDAGLTPASLVTGGYKMDITNPLDRVDYIKLINGNLLRPYKYLLPVWNLDTTAYVTFFHSLGTKWKQIQMVTGWIRSDDDLYHYPVGRGAIGADPNLFELSISQYDQFSVRIDRRTGSSLDNPNFSSTAFSRGEIIIWVEE